MKIIVSKNLEHLVRCFQYQLENGHPLHSSLVVSDQDILTELFWCSGLYLNCVNGQYFIDDSPEYRRKIDNSRNINLSDHDTRQIKSNDIVIDNSSDEIIRISIFRK